LSKEARQDLRRLKVSVAKEGRTGVIMLVMLRAKDPEPA
jgi:hypothetical protein